MIGGAFTSSAVGPPRLFACTVTSRARGKTYVYGEYMDILNKETEA